MTLDEAIQTLEIETGSRHIPSDPELHKAMCLGSEALKSIKAWRNIEDNVDLMYLPGETLK